MRLINPINYMDGDGHAYGFSKTATSGMCTQDNRVPEWMLISDTAWQLQSYMATIYM